MRAASAGVAPSAMSSCHRSSRCWVSSSTISASRAGAIDSAERRARMSGLQSGPASDDPGRVDGSDMFRSRHEADRLDEGVPGLALLRQRLLACRREAVEAATALPRLLDPRALDPAALLEAIEQGVERVQMEDQPPAGLRVDQLAELVAVPWPGFEHRQEQQLSRALLELTVQRRQVDVCHRQIIAQETSMRTTWLAAGLLPAGVGGIVGRVDVVDRERTDAVGLDDGAVIGPRVVRHLRRQEGVPAGAERGR